MSLVLQMAAPRYVIGGKNGGGGVIVNTEFQSRSMGFPGLKYFPGTVSAVPQLFPLPTNPRMLCAWYQQIQPDWGLPAASTQLTGLAKSMGGIRPGKPEEPRESPRSGKVKPFINWACV